MPRPTFREASPQQKAQYLGILRTLGPQAAAQAVMRDGFYPVDVIDGWCPLHRAFDEAMAAGDERCAWALKSDANPHEWSQEALALSCVKARENWAASTGPETDAAAQRARAEKERLEARERFIGERANQLEAEFHAARRAKFIQQAEKEFDAARPPLNGAAKKEQRT